jgi:hypothetical protein
MSYEQSIVFALAYLIGIITIVSMGFRAKKNK